jgi:hypothetical protein
MGQRRVRRGKKNYEPLLGCASPEIPLGRICGESARRPRSPPRLNRPSAHFLPLRCCLTSRIATITCYDFALPWFCHEMAGATQGIVFGNIRQACGTLPKTNIKAVVTEAALRLARQPRRGPQVCAWDACGRGTSPFYAPSLA